VGLTAVDRGHDGARVGDLLDVEVDAVLLEDAVLLADEQRRVVRGRVQRDLQRLGLGGLAPATSLARGGVAGRLIRSTARGDRERGGCDRKRQRASAQRKAGTQVSSSGRSPPRFRQKGGSVVQ